MADDLAPDFNDLMTDWATAPLPAMAHVGGKMESQYDARIGRAILGRMWCGETVAQIAADPAMPCYATIYHWRRLHDDFRVDWDSVREAMAALRLEARDAGRARAVASGRRRGGGRRSTYTPALAAAVCERIEAGAAMSEINRTPGWPTAKMVYRWLRNEPAFRAMYAEACAIRAMALTEWIHDIAVRASPSSLANDQARVARIEGRIGTLTPRTYRPAARPLG